jgi:myo-inositol 2-dehydrogenase/D-chiro-inositol 1-dehydrogenase
VLSAGNIRENQVEHWGDAGCLAAKPEHFFLQRYRDAYAAEWRHFVEVLHGRTRPECSGVDGERALYLADKALESLATGRAVSL